MELTYTKVGDYYIPDLTFDDETEYKIGVYGRMRQRFLEEHHPSTYNRMLLYGELWKHLASIDAACHERMDFLIPAMAKREGVTAMLQSRPIVIFPYHYSYSLCSIIASRISSGGSGITPLFPAKTGSALKKAS